MIKTNRLILRIWRESDLLPFGELNRDPLVREFFPNLMSQEESDQMVRRFEEKIAKDGYCFWAVEVPGISDFIGFVGLNRLDPKLFPVSFAPAVEIGWRLSRKYWGQGFASEGALACLDYGFEKLGLSEIVSFTAVNNFRSRKVMEKIGMHHDLKGDFDHPAIADGHPLKRHVLYRIKKDDVSNQTFS